MCFGASTLNLVAPAQVSLYVVARMMDLARVVLDLHDLVGVAGVAAGKPHARGDHPRLPREELLGATVAAHAELHPPHSQHAA